MSDRFDRPTLLVLAAAHGANDFFQGAVPALVPFLLTEHHLTIAAAAGFVLASNLLSSVLQPLLGWLADRLGLPWLVWSGLVAAAAGVALAVLAPSYVTALLCVGFAGLGIAAFHPEAMRAAAVASGPRRATGMSWFAIGGSMGFAVAPMVVAPVASRFGLQAVAWLALPAVAFSAVVARTCGTAAGPRLSPAARRAQGDARPDRWWAFARLAGSIFCRSVVFVGLNTFLPLYWVARFHQPREAGALALTAMLVSGLGGSLLGGRLADRHGTRPILVAALAALGPLLLGFLTATTAEAALAWLVPVGIAIYIPSSIILVMGQDFLPNHVGTASGVTAGLAITVGGLMAPILGRVADHEGVPAALWILAGFPFAAAALAWTLPRQGPRAAPAPARTRAGETTAAGVGEG